MNNAFHVSPGTYIDISVHDTGSGIDPDDLSHIFEPFFTTKKEGEGTGLGLAAAYGTVQQHKGSISVYSEKGKGTVFHIMLPLAHAKAEEKQHSVEIQTGHGTILLVDDEPVMRTTGAAILENCGYTVLLGTDGEDAVRVFEENQDNIDLVVCDMIMPKMNGRDCFLKIRELNSDVAFILSSGFSQSADMNELKEKGINGFIQKPFRGAELSQIVADAIKEQR